MRILYFTRDYTPHDHRFLASLAESEHQVFFLPLERRGHRQEARPLPPGITPVSWAGGEKPARLWDVPRLLRSLRRVIDQIKPDVLHAGPVQTAALLAALSGFRPLVTMSWGSDMLVDAERRGFYRWATSYVLKRSAVFLGDCDAVRQKGLAFGYPDEQIITFPWGVDLDHFSPGSEDGGLRRHAGWAGGTFVVLHVRSWAPVYGVDVFAKAFVTAAQRLPELRLLMPGDGPMAEKIRQIFIQGGVIDRIKFSGQVKQADLPDYYRAADLYVSASHSDGSSVSLMEALACGLPALVSDIPGNREWIEHGVQGWQFPDGDAEALAAGILQAAAAKENLVKMGQAARQLAEARADWRRNFKKLLDAYQLAQRDGIR